VRSRIDGLGAAVARFLGESRGCGPGIGRSTSLEFPRAFTSLLAAYEKCSNSDFGRVGRVSVNGEVCPAAQTKFFAFVPVR